jgi:hypothetical protein
LPPPGTEEYPPKPLGRFNIRYYHHFPGPLSGLSLSVVRIGMDSPVACVRPRIWAPGRPSARIVTRNLTPATRRSL